MAGGPIGSEGLIKTLGRAEPAVVNRTWDYKDLGSVEVLLTPKDVAKRSRRSFWHYGRAKFPLGHANKRAGEPIAAGISEGKVTFPEKCATCLASPSTGVIYEIQGEILKEGSARFRAKDRRVVIAANWERVWYSIPYCETHAKKANGAAFGETLTNLAWVAFRNEDYAAEFGDLNRLEPRHFVRRWWAVLLGVAALLLLLAVGNLATLSNDENAGSLPVGIVLLLVGVALLAYLYVTLVAPWRAQRRSKQANQAESRPR